MNDKTHNSSHRDGMTTRNDNGRSSQVLIAERIRDINVFSLLRIAVNTIVLFFVLFEFPLVGPLTSRKLAALFCALFLIINFKKNNEVISQCVKRRYIGFFALMIACALIAQWNEIGIFKLSSNVYIEPYYYIWIIVYYLIFPLYFCISYKNIKEFAISYIAIMLLQSMVVFSAAANTSFRLFIYENFSTSDGRFDSTVYWGTRIVGIYLDSSFGSITMSLACILLVYLRLDGKISRIPFIFLFVVILAATFFVGRTGLYLEIVILLAYLLLEREFSTKVLIGICVVVGCLVALSTVLSNVNGEISKLIVGWATELFNEDTRTNTIDILTSMDVPPFSSQMILGTNVILGVLPDGSPMTSDSGYARAYSCIGVVGFALYYFGMLLLLRSWVPKPSRPARIFIALLILIAFVIEIKEPYFMKYNYTIVVMVIVIFASMNRTGIYDRHRKMMIGQ